MTKQDRNKVLEEVVQALKAADIPHERHQISNDVALITKISNPLDVVISAAEATIEVAMSIVERLKG